MIGTELVNFKCRSMNFWHQWIKIKERRAKLFHTYY